MGHTSTIHVEPEGVIEVLEGTETLKCPEPSRFPAIVCVLENGAPFQKYCDVGLEGET
jgi:hypothetical protein